MEQTHVEDWLAEGIAAARQGEQVKARRLLARVVEADPAVEEAWWWLSEVVDDPQKRAICLENVLRLNPSRAQARARLRRLEAEQENGNLGYDATPHGYDPVDTGLEDPFQCVYCAQPTEPDDNRCPHCGGKLVVYERVAPRRTMSLMALLVVLGALAAWSGVESFGAVLRLSGTGELSGGLRAMDDLGFFDTAIFEPASLVRTPLLRSILGDVTGLDYTLARRLFFGAGVRAGLLVVLAGLLLLRWVPAYYAALAVFLVGMLWDLMQILGGYTGWLTGLVGIALGMMGLRMLFRAEVNFALEPVRARVKLHTAVTGGNSAYYWGVQYRNAGLHALALRHFRHAVGQSPSNADYYKQLCLSFAQVGRYEQSLKALAQARQLSPDDTDLTHIDRIVREIQQKAG